MNSLIKNQTTIICFSGRRNNYCHKKTIKRKKKRFLKVFLLSGQAHLVGQFANLLSMLFTDYSIIMDHYNYCTRLR